MCGHGGGGASRGMLRQRGSRRSHQVRGTDATRRPITDLGTGCYLQYRGGLYPNGENALSGAHLAAGLAAAARIAPLDVAGQPSASGKYVLVSIGMSNTTQEFCNDGAQA